MTLRNELEIERIFSYAAVLDESGRQKNAIWAWKNMVYIINSDKTIILQFESSQDVFKDPIGFYAASYSSSNFQPNGEYIVFFKDELGGWVSDKTIKAPLGSFPEIENLFYSFLPVLDSLPFIKFHKDALAHLNDKLSHIEFKVTKGKAQIIQRDIYSGEITVLKRPKPEGLEILEYSDFLPEEMSPIGMRTNDFFSLFNFNEEIKIYFPAENPSYFVIEGTHNSMTGIVAGCLYDDIGTIITIGEEANGREKSQDRSNEQEANRTINPSQNTVQLRKRI